MPNWLAMWVMSLPAASSLTQPRAVAVSSAVLTRKSA